MRIRHDSEKSLQLSSSESQRFHVGVSYFRQRKPQESSTRRADQRSVVVLLNSGFYMDMWSKVLSLLLDENELENSALPESERSLTISTHLLDHAWSEMQRWSEADAVKSSAFDKPSVSFLGHKIPVASWTASASALDLTEETSNNISPFLIIEDFTAAAPSASATVAASSSANRTSPSSAAIFPGPFFHDVRLVEIFGEITPALWRVWEAVMVGASVLIFSPGDASKVSKAVTACIS
jgi:hypothetical protein